MIVLTDVLGREEVLAVREGLEVAPFREGRATAGRAAGQVKDNEQARGDDSGVIGLGRRVRLGLEAHSIVRTLARPLRWSSILFSRYGPGQQYGLHADNAAMYDEHGGLLRTDLSFTLFLSDPGTYDGGALLIRDLTGDRELRLPAGSGVLYPTGQLHSVTPVTRGVRLACVGWMQSVVRRADQREILHDLEQLRNGVEPEGSSHLLDKTIGNLLRMWGET